jgi:hypothetical protein
MRRLGVIVLVVLAGLALWAVALFSIGRTGEDLCLGHMGPERTSFITNATLFPPSFECRYSLVDGSIEVDSHPVRAWVTFGAVAFLLLIYFVSALFVWRAAARPPAPARAFTDDTQRA